MPVTETYTISKEYEKLLEGKRRIEGAMRAFIVRRVLTPTGRGLEAIAALKLKGGPRDLSSRLDFYLYH